MNERNILEILGKNLHDIRFEKNISLQELAKTVNINIEELRKFEAGESSNIKMHQYIEIANALSVSYEKMTKGIQFVD